jgi:hypothetical protein
MALHSVDPRSQRAAVLTVTATVVVVVAVAALVVAASLRAGGEGAGGGVAGVESAGSATAASADRRARVSVPQAVRAVTVLREWDAARAEAWQAGDAPGLRRLYVPGATAGERDVAMLRRWIARGLRVEGMSMQVFAVRVVQWRHDRLVLVVDDRLAAARAVRVADGERWDLPRDRASTRRLEFRRTTTGWRLDAAYDRPAASTASTSGSAKS